MFLTIPAQKWTSFMWTCFLMTENLYTGESNQTLTKSVFPFSQLKKLLWSTHNQPWLHENPLWRSLAWNTYLAGLLLVVNLHFSGMIVETGPILETLEDKFWKKNLFYLQWRISWTWVSSTRLAIWYVFACEVWCKAGIPSVSPLSEQTGEVVQQKYIPKR